MTMGTKSVLYGAHCFFIHPWFVALGWYKLYGFRTRYIGLDAQCRPTYANLLWSFPLWVSFFVHDFGYIGKPNMDGEEGEQHPKWGARLMGKLFGAPWEEFTLFHSRYFAKSAGQQPSKLCCADKMAIALTPSWLYLPMVRATGEIREYMAHATYRHEENPHITARERAALISDNELDWHTGVREYCARWAVAHADGKTDTWTTDSRNRATLGPDGVWK